MMATYVEQSSGHHKCQLFKSNASNADTLDVVMAEDTIDTHNAGTETEWEDLCFVSSSRFMYVYYHSNTGATRAKIGTISGSGTTWSVSWSSAQTIDGVSTANYGGMKLCKIGANRVAILAKAKNANCRWSDDRPGIIIVDITGTNTITYRNFYNPSSQYMGNEWESSLTYNSTDDLLLATWTRSTSIGYVGALKVASGTSATITSTSGGYITIENSAYGYNVTTWDSANNKFIHAYKVNSTIRTKVVTVNSSSLAVTAGSAVNYAASASNNNGMAICRSSSGSIYLTYSNNSRNPFQLLDSSFDGSAVSWVHASPSTTIDGYAEGLRQVSLPSTRIMIVFGLNGLSNRGYIFNLKTLNSTTNLSTDKRNFIGFAEDAINDTATGTIKLRGNVVSGQSGLTIGTLYEVQGAGTLNANWQSNSVGLRALSATTGQIIENTGI